MSSFQQAVPAWLKNAIAEWEQFPLFEDISLHELATVLALRSDIHFADYLPTKHASSYFQRLQAWLDNIDNPKAKQALLHLAADMAFFGTKEIDQLLHIAFTEHISPWLVDIEGIELLSPQSEAQFAAAIKRTWFVPLTDSMPIADFCHVNHLAGSKFRPDLRTLMKFSTPDKVLEYLASEDFSYVVVLEDFVGSGQQCHDCKAIWQAIKEHYRVLFVPLVICRKGLDRVKGMGLESRPVLALDATLTMTSSPTIGEYPIADQLRDIIAENSRSLGSRGLYGFKNVGSLVAMRSNCPNNTLTLIRNQGQWKALFPRVNRQ